MSEELRDFELSSSDPESPGGAGRSGVPYWPYVVGVAVVLLVVAAVLWWRRGPSDVAEPPLAGPETTMQEPSVSEAAESKLDLGEVPGLAQSDPWLRNVVRQLSSHPQLAEWLVTDELIRRFVVSVDNLAEGTSPRKHLPALRPKTKFLVQQREGRLFIDPATYDRYDLLVDVVESLDPQGVGELYRAIKPLCQRAYQDLGYPAEDFDRALGRSVQRLLATPIIEGPIELQPKVTAFEFADPELENLSPASKQFLRMGPDNLRRLQAKVRQLAQAAGVDLSG